jgi:hypothetical protein
MKPKQEKILLEDLIGCYTPETIANYRNDPQFLAAELRDMHTLTLLAQTQFSDIVVVKVSIARMSRRSHLTMIRPLKHANDPPSSSQT